MSLMKDGPNGNAVAGIAVIAVVSPFFGQLGLFGRFAVRAAWFALPPHLFEICNTGVLSRENLEDFDNIHDSALNLTTINCTNYGYYSKVFR